MVAHPSPRPVALSIAGHDPGGGAGIQADIESFLACGVDAATLITATTTQDTVRFLAVHPQRCADVVAQAELLCRDQSFAACKVGLLGSAEMAHAVAGILRQLRPAPVVVDPILRSGSGTDLADAALLHTLRTELLPLASVITPNAAEARRLADTSVDADAAAYLLGLGVPAVLVTGADEDTPDVRHVLYRAGQSPLPLSCPRLSGTYHGSGCTLSASLAAFLARGLELEAAVRAALDFTWQSLSRGRRRGRGQWHPDRRGTGKP